MNPASLECSKRVAVIGGGAAGLMAAEVLVASGVRVDLFDAMPSVGRKFLLAGKGGLNLTHSEPFDRFLDRFGTRRPAIEPMLQAFDPAALRRWASDLGVATFVGSSGRVFPIDLKAAPLLRAWLHRLRSAGVAFHMRHRWHGWPDNLAGQPATTLRFRAHGGEVEHRVNAVVLALGGGSWARLGSDGAWLPWLAAQGVEVAALRPSNCGFVVARAGAEGHLEPGWSAHLASRFAGQPLKNVALALQRTDGSGFDQAGEFVVTERGIEGSLVYALSPIARDAIAEAGQVTLHLDLLPQRSAAFVVAEVARPRGSRSLATHLKSRLGLDGVKAALLHELLTPGQLADPASLATVIKALPLLLVATCPLDEAISSAGGVRFEALDDGAMLRALPGVFCAGEMLDWEAPTGGYLLNASMASGVAAAQGALRWLLR